MIDTGIDTAARAGQMLGATLIVSARLSSMNDRLHVAIGLSELSDRLLRLKIGRSMRLGRTIVSSRV